MENTNEKSPQEQPEKDGGIMDSIHKIDDNVKNFIEDTDEKISAGISSGIKKTKSFFKRLFTIGLILLVVAGIGYMLYANYTYSEGTRAGNLIKISKKGYVFKTYEGQLKLGGIDLSNANEGLSDTWSFSVSDEEVVKKLEKVQGEKVILRYKEINQAMPWQGKTNYFVYDVE